MNQIVKLLIPNTPNREPETLIESKAPDIALTNIEVPKRRISANPRRSRPPVTVRALILERTTTPPTWECRKTAGVITSPT